LRHWGLTGNLNISITQKHPSWSHRLCLHFLVRYILDSLLQTNEKNDSMRHHKLVNINVTDIAPSFTLIEEYYVVLELVINF
jgi:hypothetical protein